MAVCNHSGMVAIYNKSQNIFLSPYVDGPIKFNTVNGEDRLECVSRFGRSFSILRIPYALKLLIYELQTMNIQLRIITEENIDQIETMNFSNNILKLHNQYEKTTEDMNKHITDYLEDITKIQGRYQNPFVKIDNHPTRLRWGGVNFSELN